MDWWGANPQLCSETLRHHPHIAQSQDVRCSGWLVVNDLPSSGNCAAILHSKHQPLEPAVLIKAHNYRSAKGWTVIGKENDPHQLANSSLTKDFPHVFYYAEAPGNGSGIYNWGKSWQRKYGPRQFHHEAPWDPKHHEIPFGCSSSMCPCAGWIQMWSNVFKRRKDIQRGALPRCCS